jgi:chorismate mutase
MSLEELRKRIDDADVDIVRLIAVRTRIAGEIGEEKKRQGIGIEDLGREKIVFEHVRKIAGEENLNPDDIENIFRQIIAAAKNAEGMIWKE